MFFEQIKLTDLSFGLATVSAHVSPGCGHLAFQVKERTSQIVILYKKKTNRPLFQLSLKTLSFEFPNLQIQEFEKLRFKPEKNLLAQKLYFAVHFSGFAILSLQYQRQGSIKILTQNLVYQMQQYEPLKMNKEFILGSNLIHTKLKKFHYIYLKLV